MKHLPERKPPPGNPVAERGIPLHYSGRPYLVQIFPQLAGVVKDGRGKMVVVKKRATAEAKQRVSEAP
jgi:hypothetical protein